MDNEEKKKRKEEEERNIVLHFSGKIEETHTNDSPVNGVMHVSGLGHFINLAKTPCNLQMYTNAVAWISYDISEMRP